MMARNCMTSLNQSIKIASIAILLNVTFCIQLYAGDREIQFEHPIKVEFMLNDLIQDRDGFLWLATSGGLIRYDGYDVKVYKKSPNSVSSDNIDSLHEDEDGILWICTVGGGLNKFDKETNSFTVYRHNPEVPNSLSDNHPTVAIEDRDGVLWVGTANGGLNRFNKKTNTFTVYRHNLEAPNSLSDDQVYALHEDSSGVLWIGTRGGLNRFNRDTHTFTHYIHDPDDPQSLSNNHVSTIIEDALGVLWVGTASDGLNSFDREEQRFTVYQHDQHDPDSLGSNSIINMYEDDSGILWIGTFAGGLNRFNRETGTFTRYTNNSGDTGSLRSNDVSAMYKDPSNILWVACLSGELEKWDMKSKGFTLYRHNPDNPASLSDNIIVPIYEDRDGVVWLGTGRGGLNKFEEQTETFTHYVPDPNDSNSLKDHFVSTMFEDSSGNFWVGTSSLSDATLCMFDRTTGKCVKFYRNDPDNPGSIAQSFAIRKILEDQHDSNILWIAIDGSGLEKFDRAKETFTHYIHAPNNSNSLSFNTLWNMYQDTSGALWLATAGGGLDKFNPKTDTFRHYTHNPDDPGSISSNTITAVYEDSTGTLWVCTTDGLNTFDRKRETFTRYTTADGFPDNTFYGILEDRNGNLWISTNGGLVKFHPERATIKVYTHSDGLQGNAFFYTSFCQTSDGDMWFGGFNGVNRFRPEEIVDNPHIPPIVLTSIKQGGEELDFGKSPERLNELELDWRHNFFEFEFAALEYSNPIKNQYKYMLEGIDKDWFYSGTRHFGRYTHLPGGTHMLRIAGSNNDGVWNEEGIAITIRVTPPFWKTGWFYAALLLAGLTGGLGVTFYVIKLHTEIVERKRTEDALRESQEWLQAIMDNTTTVIYLKDIQGHYLLINRQWQKLWHKTIEESIGRKDVEIFPTEIAEAFRANDLKVLDAGIPLQFEELVPHDHEMQTYLSIKFPMYNAVGDPYSICGISTDITERKRAEEEHLAHLRFLENMELIDKAIRPATDLEQMLRDVIETVFSIFDCDRAWLLYPCDPHAPSFRVPMETTRPEYPGALALNLEVPMSAPMAEDCQMALDSQEPVMSGPAFENQVSKDTAQQFAVQAQMFMALRVKIGSPWKFGMHQCSYPRVWTQAEQSLFKGIGRRITDALSSLLFLRDLHASKEELQRAKDAAEASNRTKSKFLTTVSHELRTPLNAILGYTQLFKSNTNLTGPQQENLAIIHRAGEHLLMLINDILDMSKLETQEMILQSTKFHLSEQLKCIEEIAMIQADQKEITFICDIASDVPPVVYGDEKRLRQILLNLLGNAVKFTDSGGKVTFRVANCELRIANLEDHQSEIRKIRFEIEDTGIGIPPEEMEAIFEPFYQVGDRLTKPDGTGLGLAISRHLARMMGSELQIRSIPEQCSIFWLEVDFRNIDEEIMEEETENETNHLPTS